MQLTIATLTRTFRRAETGEPTLKIGMVSAPGVDAHMVISMTRARDTISFALTADEWKDLVSDMSTLRYMAHRNDAQAPAPEDTADTQFSHIDDIAPIVAES